MAEIPGFEEFTITLGKLSKPFCKRNSGRNQDAFLNDLLGKEAYRLLFSKADGSGNLVKNKNKIINCSDTSAEKPHRRILQAYFTEEEETAERGLALRSHLLEMWNRELQNPPKGFVFEEAASGYPNDPLFDTSPQMENIQRFLGKYQKASGISEQAEFLTVLTIVAITRLAISGECIPAWVLPEDWLDNDLSSYDAEVRSQILAGDRALAKGDWQEAVDILEPLMQFQADPHSSLFSTNAQTSRFKAGILLSLSKAHRGLMAECTDAEEREEYAKQVRDDLISGAEDYQGLSACREIIREYRKALANPYDTNVIFSGEVTECARFCHMLIENHPEARVECGETYWILFELTTKYGYKPSNQESERFYFQKSLAYGWKEAVKADQIRNSISLTEDLVRSECISDGCFFLNDSNEISNIIEKTSPVGWRRMSLCIDSVEGHDDSWTSYGGPVKHFLISDDYDRNLRELLRELQMMKDHAGNLTDPFRRVEFYIRGKEDQISPYIDTAMSRMGEDWVFPVYILDEDKYAARVLARHPLFYPIRRREAGDNTYLTYIVLGNTPCCERLVLEAFWMMTFSDPSIDTEILLIGPGTDEIINRVLAVHPGMQPAGTEKAKRRSGGEIAKTFPYIRAEDCDYLSDKMISAIRDTLERGNAYFSIDTGSDLENSSLAIQLRELTIQMWAVKAKRNPEFPVITFRCRDADLANLSRRTVVLNEDCGANWYNNYALIPFGRLDKMYSWDALTADPFEEISQNVHLQYYMKEAFDLRRPEDMEDYKSGLRSYYQRTYNRDSSMAVCLSLPYRLFQGIGIGGVLTPLLPPEPFDILDEEAFFSGKNMAYYLRIWEENSEWRKDCREEDPIDETKWIYDENSLLYQCGKWEHDRWNRFMISRKWQGVNNWDVTRSYYEEGNHRQQLYIGRIHPLIDSFRKVEGFGPYWKKLAKKKGIVDFCENDISSIQTTADILRCKWTRSAEEYFQNPRD